MEKSIDYKRYFQGKYITKQGFGILGRGMGVVKFLLENGATILVTDIKLELEFENNIRELENFMLDKNIAKEKVSYVFGQHRTEDFEKIKIKNHIYISGCDYVVQASGVPKDNIYLAHAKANGIEVYQESSLFVKIVNEYNESIEKSEEKQNKENKIKIIGVTGTRGKTTTTFLIKKIIENYLETEKSEYKNISEKGESENMNRKVYFGGNIQNVATLDNIKYLKGGDIIVMELDSWILQGFKDINYSPDVAVFTTFMADHMNYYKGDMADYFADKAAIFEYQKAGDIFVTTDIIKKDIEKYKNKYEKIENVHSFFLNKQNIEEYATRYKSILPGEHNKINTALAVKACEEFVVRDSGMSSSQLHNIIQNSLNYFTGVAGRLEMIREIRGVKYYNDTTSTTPDSLMVALESFKNKNIILICGGRDKELDVSVAADKIMDFKNKNIVKDIILLSDETTTGTEKLKSIFENNNFIDFVEAQNISKAVLLAKEKANEEGIVMFSPGFASFGMFKNEYDRGDKYNSIVNNL